MLFSLASRYSRSSTTLYSRCMLSSPFNKYGNAYYARLSQRRIISVSGADAKSVLQGLQTNDMSILNTTSKVALYSQFLNAQGRILNDAIIIRPQVVVGGQVKPKENEYWLDVDTKKGMEIMRHVKKYCLRKKVSINDYSSLVNVYAVFSDFIMQIPSKEGEYCENIDQSIYDPEQTDEVYTQIAYTDPRISFLGMRMIVPKNDSLKLDSIISEVSENHYNQQRLLLGISQGEEVIERLPFTVNLDFMNGVSFNKGCYVGQELTARTYHTGIVRRRVVPFVIRGNEGQALPSDIINPSALNTINTDFNTQLVGESLLDKDNKEIGKVLANNGNIGIALTRYMDKGDKQEDLEISTSSGLKGQLVYSAWFNMKVQEYLSVIKEKEEKAAMF